jgi:hypothetical protein
MLHPTPEAWKYEAAEASAGPRNSTLLVILPKPDDIPQELSTDPTHVKHEASPLQNLQCLLAPPHTGPEQVGGAHPHLNRAPRNLIAVHAMPHTQVAARRWHILHTLHAQLAQARNAATAPIGSWPILASDSPGLPLSFTKIVGLDCTTTNHNIAIVGLLEGHPMGPDPLQRLTALSLAQQLVLTPPPAPNATPEEHSSSEVARDLEFRHVACIAPSLGQEGTRTTNCDWRQPPCRR